MNDRSLISRASTSRDLVLTTDHRVDYDYIAPFVLSLKRTGYQGHIVMFASGMDETTLSRLWQDGVSTIPFHFAGKRRRQRLAYLWPLWRWLFSTGISPDWKKILTYRVFHLMYLRYLLYADFLSQHPGSFDRILLADCRDVFFQADPFAWPMTPGLHVFLEETKNIIGASRLHRLWMGCQFGLDYVEFHGQTTASCCGTVFGGTLDIRNYLAQMIAVTMTARNLAKIDGGDQGIHNYLIIQQRLKHLTIHENRRGPVLTMGVMPPADVRLNAKTEVLNEDGAVAPVLHQYDRIPGLKTKLVSRLG
jgi:hypothetical protein